MDQSRIKRLIKAPWLRISISIMLLAWVVSGVSLGGLLIYFSQLRENAIFTGLMFVIPGAAVLLSALRWRTLLAAIDIVRSVGSLYKAFLVGNFFNQFIPSTVGGDIARAWWIKSSDTSTTNTMMVVAADRLIGLCGICVVGLLAAHTQSQMQISRFAGAFLLIMLAGLTTVASPTAQAGLRRLFAKTRFLRGQLARLATVLQGINALRTSPGSLAIAFAISVALQAVVIFQFAVISRALGLDISISALAVIVPLVSLVTTLPVSINGIGLREAAFVVIGAPFGLSNEGAVAMSLLFLFVATLYAMVGGAIYLLSHR